MVSLAELKKRSKTNLETLTRKVKEEASGNRNAKDERFWTLERNKDGNAYAIIRFLPISEVDSDNEDALCWAKTYSHAFKNDKTGLWYIENSLTTIGKQDAISELNRKLWNSGNEDDKKQVSKQKRKLQFISNIYVVKDPNNPENEGKVFLYKYGKKIYDKIMAVIQPPEGFDEEPGDPFDFWEGRNFKLKIRTVDEYPNYDTSSFDDPSVISDKNGKELSDAEIEKIYKKEYSLLEFVDPNNKALFKSPEDLEKQLNRVLGITPSESRTSDKGKSEEKSPKKNDRKPVEEEEDEVVSTDDDENEDIDIDDILKDI